MQRFGDFEDLRSLDIDEDSDSEEFRPRRFVLRDLSSTDIMRASHSVSNLALTPDVYPSPPPEEEVIPRRSKRLSTPCRPPSIFGDCFQCTPCSEDTALLQMARKRLMLTPDKSPLKSPEKRPRLQAPKVPLHTELGGYSQQQLVDVIDNLVCRHPCLEDEIRSELKSPDIKPMEGKLSNLRKDIYRSIPSTRWSSSRDSHCFRKVKGHLQAYKKICLDQARSLTKAQCWEAALKYVCIALKFTSKLPDWDEPSHNSIKAQCFSVLAAQCMISLKRGLMADEVLSKYLVKLKSVAHLNKEIEPCVVFIEKALNN
ncbi:hypothetical protein CAPTEDRAFT_224629 [Capitella teleta]|uniref:Uncharacterized protein n=1 Tax=Capitella teleta TaxID=283909 RepID=R7VER3_CAPTE|nr:hypothetical protein CAPTEDRAFT_224629 [Capitella teleta]|eukprot:ELU14155.1 hypothetical protein CAPTEDRAFT_224629 [Capitella teleta]